MLKEFNSSEAEIECEMGKDFFLPVATDEMYDSMVSFLLAAFLAGNNVNVGYNECYMTHFKLGLVVLEK